LHHKRRQKLTITVIALALALPFGLGLVSKNLSHFNQQWDGELSVSVYLKSDVTLANAKQTSEAWLQQNRIKSTTLITPDEALEQISKYSDAQNWVEELGSNPLPSVIVVVPNGAEEASLNALSKWLSNQPTVDSIQLDNQWVKRLNGLYGLTQIVFWVLAIALGATALMIISNTLRLDVENRKEEVFVIRLVGGTDTYVRRPFLYTGLWYGLWGSVCALGLVGVGGMFITQSIDQLGALYESTWTLIGPDWLDISNLLICGTALGLAGAWVAVNKHLSNQASEEIPVY